MRKLCLILAMLCLLTACAQPQPNVATAVPTDPPAVQWEYGSISAKNGKDRAVAQGTCLRTVGYLELAGYAGLMPDIEYAINWFAYDGQMEFLGSHVTVMGSGVGISKEEILEKQPEAVYFRVILRSAYQETEISLEESANIRLYTAREGWPTVPVTEKEIANLSAIQGKWAQDGEAFGDRLFIFKDDGTANVYNVQTGEFLDGFVLGGRDKLMPHVNSASFSDQYYEPGDKYPLLYTSMYNNLTPQNTQILGFCCVYRIMESDGEFSADLVQAIWVSFVGDRSLWLSPISNERPFGNFVVDTDRGLLYAFVPRDDSRTTRFFGFSLPDPKAGNDSSTYGCKLLYLSAEDIMHRFDVEYFSSPQGCCYADGKIYSVEGFGAVNTVPPFLRVVDVKSGKLELSFNLGQLGLDREPEVITSTGGELYYLSTDMILYRLDMIE